MKSKRAKIGQKVVVLDGPMKHRKFEGIVVCNGNEYTTVSVPRKFGFGWRVNEGEYLFRTAVDNSKKLKVNKRFWHTKVFKADL